jgi:hypothetical protein
MRLFIVLLSLLLFFLPAANTDLNPWLPEEYRKAVAATLSARLRDPSIEIAMAFR